MKLLRNWVLMATVLTATGACPAQSAPGGSSTDQFQVRVVNLTLQDFSTDKLVIGVGLAADSKRNITVDGILLSGLQLNGVPIYVAPFKRRFKLRNDRSVRLPEQLQVTVYLRNLDSLKPLRDAISSGYATLSGVALIHVPLNPLQRLVLLSSHAEVSTNLHQQLAFDIPGGRVAAASLVKILGLADEAFKALDSTLTSVTKLGGK